MPEYYPTRAERALLAEWMPSLIRELRPRSLVELGAGSAEKTRAILDAMRAAGSAEVYVPVDISADFLELTAASLREEYPGIRVLPAVADFTRSLELPPGLPRPALVTFLGSTIGNFPPADAVAILRRVRDAMEPGDRFLLGVDLRKDVATLEAAYDDSRGVTAEFNLNILTVLNRDFGADIDRSGFEHLARYNRCEHRIEMHLVSKRPQLVTIPGIGAFQLAEGETIRTEISAKYDRQSVAEIFDGAGLELAGWESGDGLFALALGAPRGTSV